MFGNRRLTTVELAALSRRLSTQLASGIDLRRILTREAEASHRSARRRFEEASLSVAKGKTLAESFNAEGDFFPPLFRELTEVGEQSGHLAEVFRQLASHYDHQVALRRTFRQAITWPVIQLVLALSIVGLLIWVMGLIGSKLDLLGLGLFGTQGLIIYLLFLSAVAAGGFFLYRAIMRGLFWTRPLQNFVMRIPVIGKALQTIAISRFAWSFGVTLESGMDLRKALALSLRSTHSWRYTSQIEPIWQSIRAGREVYEAIGATGVFPRSLVDAIEVGEHSGRMSETLAVLSEQYQEEARLALGTLTVFAGFVVWALVAMLIISIIFRIVGSYVNLLNDAASGKF